MFVSYLLVSLVCAILLQVFTFGSVPLKTYLPDGDIDLSAFSNSQDLKDTWAHQVRDMLESEEKNENAEFRVKEVQYIQAEVCTLLFYRNNFVVIDLSFMHCPDMFFCCCNKSIGYNTLLISDWKR